MDIHILHNGQQTGPFTEETVQAMLKQGELRIDDLAWRTGMEKWQPLHAVLYPAAQAPSAPPPPPPEALRPPPRDLPAEPAKAEPASARQKAFLTYLGLPFSNDLTKERAALMVNDAMENPKHAARIKKWDEERLRLYPDIFADEIKAKRENRAQFFLEVCQGEGAEFFEGVTKAHTQLLVGYLDVQHPNWDQQERSAKYDYFFPAICEKFPQVVKKSAKGRFKYPDGPKVAAELVRRPAVVRARPASSPVGAMFRGLVFGGIVLALLYGAVKYGRGELKLPIGTGAASPVALPAAEKKPGANPAQTAQVTQRTEPAPTPKPIVRATPVPASVPEPTVPMPAEPPPAIAANDPAMTTPAAPEAPLPASTSLFDTTQPPATPPPAEPLNPFAATPAPVQAVVAKVNKATTVMLKFGSSSIRAGTPVQVVAVEGAMTRIRFGPDIVSVPTANLDLPESSTPPAIPSPTPQ
jgi:hypothetical protein